ncbi:hypothetical protein Tco_0935717 [Tanacetum coccineum]
MNEAVKTAVQLQSDKLKSEAQADNEDFINKIDENMKKIIKEDTVTFKRLRDDQDKDEEPFAGSNRRSKRRLAGKEPESTSAPKEKTSKSTDKSKEGSKSHHTSTGKSAQEEPIHDDEDLDEPAHQEFDTGFTEDQSVNETTQHPDCSTLDKHLARNEDPHESFNELMDTPLDFSTFVMNQLKVYTLTPELLVGRTYELMKVNRESARDVYSKHRILAVTKLKIIEWHNYEHLDWIPVRRNNDMLYTFKESKLTNLNVEERLALGVSLRMFTRSVVLRRRVEDL